jgi:hypothetical protein
MARNYSFCSAFSIELDLNEFRYINVGFWVRKLNAGCVAIELDVAEKRGDGRSLTELWGNSVIDDCGLWNEV